MHEDKERWLKYHDKSCADMPGWLPLAKGLPVVLSDHLDRLAKQSKISTDPADYDALEKTEINELPLIRFQGSIQVAEDAKSFKRNADRLSKQKGRGTRMRLPWHLAP